MGGLVVCLVASSKRKDLDLMFFAAFHETTDLAPFLSFLTTLSPLPSVISLGEGACSLGLKIENCKVFSNKK